MNRGALLAGLTLAGCFGAHDRDGLDDGGVPPGDGGPVIRDCSEAVFASAGAACDFDGACGGGVGSCDMPTSIRCVDGRIRISSPICTIAPVRNCEEYLAWGTPSAFCLSDEFEGCTIDEGDCCQRRIACDGNVIVDETLCSDCEPEGVCPGYAPPPPEFPGCTTSSDCPDFGCSPVGAPRPCGACRLPERACESDSECAPGDLCVEELHACSCDGPDTRCATDCRSFESDPCAEGSRCGADGRCAPIDCGDGWACPTNMRCHGGFGGAIDEHGCARLPCVDASACDCGVCMDGQCQDGPGVCLPPVP